MRDLALWLDTTLPGLSMSILGVKNDSWEVLASFHEDKTGATSQLNTVFSDLLGKSAVSVSEINHLIMGIGPGSFTGIKIGMAWGLGFAAGFETFQAIPKMRSKNQDDKSAKSKTEISPRAQVLSATSELTHPGYGEGFPSNSLRICGVSALELAAKGLDDQPLNILLKVTSAHGFLLRTEGKDFDPEKPREIAVKIEELPHVLHDGQVHLACPWAEVSGILSDLRGKVIEHKSLRHVVEKGLVRCLNQKNFQWRDEFPLPRYLKLSTAEEKLKLTEKGE